MGKRGPKSKYDPRVHPQLAKWMCRSGLTNEEIAAEFHIAHKTLLVWANEHEEMGKALKTSRDLIDSLVEDALLKRALGFEYEEIEMIVDKDKETKPIRVKKIKKVALPDTGAMIFWLKCRMPDKWREPLAQNQGNVFNITNGVLVVPQIQSEEDWNEQAKEVFLQQTKAIAKN